MGLVILGIWTFLIIMALARIPGGLAVLVVLLGLAGEILLFGWLTTLWLIIRDFQPHKRAL